MPTLDVSSHCFNPDGRQTGICCADCPTCGAPKFYQEACRGNLVKSSDAFLSQCERIEKQHRMDFENVVAQWESLALARCSASKAQAVVDDNNVPLTNEEATQLRSELMHMNKLPPIKDSHEPVMGDVELQQLIQDHRWSVRQATNARMWDRRELSLFLQSEGKFNPTTMVAKRRPKTSTCARVSMVVPTMESKQASHPQVWAVFEEKHWADKELIVVETFVNMPCKFFQCKAECDDRLVYIPIQVEPYADFTISLKRSMCTHMATGTYIANFEDGELCAPKKFRD